MKKILISAIAAVSSLAASADSFNFTPSFNPAGQQAFTSAVGQVVSQATMMPGEIAEVLAGNQITSINIFSPSQNNNTDPNILTSATVFLTHDLYEDPFYTKDVTLSTTPYELNHCEIDPYTIEADKPLYIGWRASIPEGRCYYITYDDLTPCFPNTCCTRIGDADWNTTGNVKELGSLCIGATVSGTDLPLYGALVLERSTLPTNVEPGSEIPVSLVLRNSLANRINTLNVEYTVGSFTKTVSVPVQCTSNRDKHTYLDTNEKGVAYFDIEVPENLSGVALPLGYRIAGVNDGEVNAFADQSADRVYFTVLDDPEAGFARNVVLEEATGTWCGYCPAGIVMMDELSKQYTDGSVILIAVHASNGSNARDAMQVDAYRPFISDFVQPVGFPSAFANREQTILPNSSHPVADFENYYNAVRAVRSPFRVEVSGEVVTVDEQFEITAKVTTAYDFDNENDHYRLTFVVVEDGVGPYSQTNYFSPASMGYSGQQLEGWSDKDAIVRGYYFNDVARAIYGYSGIENSLPGEFTANGTYEFKQLADFGAIKASEIRLVAMIIDTANNTIVNAAECKFTTNLTGIDTIDTDKVAEDSEAEYFNMQGVRVANPAKGGIYIVRRGSEASKVLVK